MQKVKFFSGDDVPLEMHRVRVVQKLHLRSVDERVQAIDDAGNNTLLLKNRDVFLDMLTDGSAGALSDHQEAAMTCADDSAAGSESFIRLEEKVREIFGKSFFLPAHRRSFCENILAAAFVTPDSVVPMNYPYPSVKALIRTRGGDTATLLKKAGYETASADPFKGNLDTDALESFIEEKGREHIPFVRMEAAASLIGGQPFALSNLAQVHKMCQVHGIPLVLDASSLADNLYFVKTREDAYKNATIKEITHQAADHADIIYFSAGKLGRSSGGGLASSNKDLYLKMLKSVPLGDSLMTYGGMSAREMEALRVGLEEAMDFDAIRGGPEYIGYMANELQKRKVPVVMPPGGLGCYLNARDFLDHLDCKDYPAGALAAAVYIAGGIRGMERGTLSAERTAEGEEKGADLELLRLSLPRRAFTLSQVKYAIDRVAYLYEQRKLIGGLEWVQEPKRMRFLRGRLKGVGNWQLKLAAQFKRDLGDSL